jgi:hypothetical protein
MGFDIFAAGVNNFQYKRDGCEDGSTFEVMKVITCLQSLDVQSFAHAGITGTGAVIDYAAPGITDLMISLATTEMLHNLSNAVCLLAMNPNASDGWIKVNAFQVNLILPNKSCGASYRFSPGDSPAAEFVSAIKNCLILTDLTNFGVLQHLSVILTRFEQHIDDTMTPKISITLTN